MKRDSIMKHYISKMKYLILPVLFIISLIICINNGFPNLPSSKILNSGISYPSGTDAYLINNLFSIIYLGFSISCGTMALYYGIVIRKETEKYLRNASFALGCFIYISGIWMLTDSTALFLFFGSIDVYCTVFISFICFMLMPLIFLEFINFLVPMKIFQVFRWLFSANMSLFLIFVSAKMEQVFYIISLSIHHILIYILAIYILVKLINKEIAEKDKAELHIGIIIFLILTIISIVAFLVGKYNIYSFIFAIGLISLIFSFIKIVLDKIVKSYKIQIQAEIYRKMAYTDALSGINNKNAFLSEQKNTSESDKLCYVIFDINNLKIINDENGHGTGDGIIRHAAEIIYGCFSPIGKCYRIGGDEFVVICTDHSESEIKAAIEKLENDIQEYNSTADIKLSIAYGYAFRTSSEMTAAQLFNKADEEMYMCKKKQSSSLTCES